MHLSSRQTDRNAAHRVPTPQRRITGSTLGTAMTVAALLATVAACGTGASATRDDSIVTVEPRTAVPPPSTTIAPRVTVEVTTTAPSTSVALPTTMPPPSSVVAAAPTARPTRLVDQFAVVAGSHMHVRCVGSGATTVILIAGFNGSREIWGSIEAPIAEGARVCSYDRFGTGTSDPPSTVQTFTSQAADLRSALRSLDEPGPFVVVGHSFGGAEAVAFASMFPDEVSGLLLLDASPASWPAAVCAVPPDGSDGARSFGETCAAFAADGNSEHLDALAAFAEIDAIASLGALPTVVVTAAAHPYPDLVDDELARLADVWNTGQRHWASLSSAGQVLTVTDTGHDIQLDQPAVVIDQINALLGATR